ncbi:MAG: amino acid ABC transporter substrate-binding protein [Gammaproteobacteria bacterium]|nr:amino acid ABC transporter substrate-binding protein [Gammaproteobacteria bacterium]
MKHLNTIIVAAVIALLVTLVTIQMIVGDSTNSTTNDAIEKSVFDRVMESGTIRVAYIFYPPFFSKGTDGSFEGLSVDIMELIGDELGLEIEWTEEVLLSAAFEGFKTNRYDVVMPGLWAIPPRAKAAAFTQALYYHGIYAFSRADDNRFSDDLTRINQPDIKLVVLEGELSQFLAERNYSDAQIITQPSMSEAPQRLMDVSTKKADVTFNEMSVFLLFDKENPNQLKPVSFNPVSTGAAGIAVPRHAHQFKDMLNTTIAHLNLSRAIEQVVGKYEGGLIPAAMPYEAQ